MVLQALLALPPFVLLLRLMHTQGLSALPAEALHWRELLQLFRLFTPPELSVAATTTPSALLPDECMPGTFELFRRSMGEAASVAVAGTQQEGEGGRRAKNTQQDASA